MTGSGTTSSAADLAALTRETQELWDAKADYWDEQMGEGNAFHTVLVGPSSERLLGVQQDELILDIACGNGQFARRMAQLGARVVATDFSARFLERARARTGTTERADRIEYGLVDATDEAQLLALGEGRFDAATCLMGLMDMPTIEPLATTLPRLLKPGGRFVFAVQHPCFNSNAVRLGVEEEDRAGELVDTLYIKTVGYLDIPPGKGAGMPGEPNPHYYFHRPIGELLAPFLRAGLLLDGLEEPHFGPEHTSARALSWLQFKTIPPVLTVRLRLV